MHARSIAVSSLILLLSPIAARARCQSIALSDPRLSAIDAQYATIERATFAKDPKLLFSVYAPDFEAHQFNGQVWKFSQSAAYSRAGMDQVVENISMSNTIISASACGRDTIVATVLQQWSRRQRVGNIRLFQTTTVQDETWVNSQGTWLRKRVDNERPGAWLIDLQRVDPSKPYDANAEEFDPHHTRH